jgi:hypothetical protein
MNDHPGHRRDDETDRARRNALLIAEQKREYAAALASSSDVESFLATFDGTSTAPSTGPHLGDPSKGVATRPPTFVRA